ALDSGPRLEPAVAHLARGGGEAADAPGEITRDDQRSRSAEEQRQRREDERVEGVELDAALGVVVDELALLDVQTDEILDGLPHAVEGKADHFDARLEGKVLLAASARLDDLAGAHRRVLEGVTTEIANEAASLIAARESVLGALERLEQLLLEGLHVVFDRGHLRRL